MSYVLSASEWSYTVTHNNNRDITERTDVLVIFFPFVEYVFLQFMWSKTMNFSVFMRASVYV